MQCTAWLCTGSTQEHTMCTWIAQIWLVMKDGLSHRAALARGTREKTGRDPTLSPDTKSNYRNTVNLNARSEMTGFQGQEEY